MPTIAADELQRFATALLAAGGATREEARHVGTSLVGANLRGYESHGVMRVPEYVKKLTVDGVEAKGVPSVVRDSGACLVVDGGNTMGQIGAHFRRKRSV